MAFCSSFISFVTEVIDDSSISVIDDAVETPEIIFLTRVEGKKKNAMFSVFHFLNFMVV